MYGIRFLQKSFTKWRIVRLCAYLLFILLAFELIHLLTEQATLYPVMDFRPPKLRLKKSKSSSPVSLLCLVLTTRRTFLKMKAINETWAKRCNKTMFFTDGQANLSNTIFLKYVKNGRNHLTQKVGKAFEYVQHFFSSYDWYLKADDDTYIIVDNLRLLLSYFDYKDAVYLGQNFKYFTKQGYNSGGAGYVISNEGLKRLVYGIRNGQCQKDGKDEDVDIGKCLHSQGVVAYDTKDKHLRETFHAGSMENHIVGPLSPMLLKYPSSNAKIGWECCSSLTISFHYVPPKTMYIMDMLLYHLTVYGRDNNDNVNDFE